ncbi:hypothetical protein V1264_000989 [Littorina saxatilis]|uniref:Protein naked cuticle homolog n=1 Tax=Littorina saxatilis TaxID=31220 RepID=A0AAN9C058_9CAEN
MSFFRGCLRSVSIVELPPQVGETETSKVLKLDQTNGDEGDENKGEKANNLNIEEFECGVQFEGSENSKQEWSFTLYNFDGHGRITKEDLASLLKALYDAVGSSIRLPPNGAKTLKLRLTVGQDRTQIHAISAGKALTGGKRKENGGSGSKAKTSKESPKAPKQFSKLNNLTRTTVKVNNQTQEAASQAQAQVQGQVEGQGEGVPPGRKQLSAEDQQQLAELVQENMERNHVKQLRRHHSDCHGSGDKPGHHKRRHRGRSSKTAAAAAAGATTTTTATAMALAEDRAGGGGCKESQDRRNYYLDLAGVDSSKLNNAPAAKVCNTNPALHPLLEEGGGGGVGGGVGSGHHRSRSHDVAGGGKCDNVRRETERLLERGVGGLPPGTHHILQHNHLRSRSFDPQDSNPRTSKTATTAAAPPANNATQDSAKGAEGGAGAGGGAGGGGSPHKHSRFRPVSLPGHVPATASPHYHRRHRHREKDHDLAMQQVAAWIERQNAWDFDGERVIVQRHHHHHIHEHHHHHHYHHYYEA